MRQAALAELDRFASPTRPRGSRLASSCWRDGGSVAGSIVELARSLPADLIVMGTHGTAQLERLMLARSPKECCACAPCPVLTVPRRAHEAGLTPHAGLQEHPVPAGLRRLRGRGAALRCLPGAREPRATASAARAGGLGRGRRARPVALDGARGFYQVLLQKEARERLHAALGPEDRARCTVEEVLASGKPYVEILRLAEKRACDLIVMGTHSGALAATLSDPPPSTWCARPSARSSRFAPRRLRADRAGPRTALATVGPRPSAAEPRTRRGTRAACRSRSAEDRTASSSPPPRSAPDSGASGPRPPCRSRRVP